MSARRAWTLACATALGCGGATTTPDAAVAADAVPDAGAFVLTSPAFVDGGALPITYTCDGAGTSPPLAWSGVPEGAVELDLLMTTLANDGLKWNWVLYAIPATANGLATATAGVGTAGLTSDGPNLAYAPPCSQGPGPKTYTFTLYAVSAHPSLPPAPSQVTGAVLTDALRTVTLAQAALSVTYTR